eukprot:Opistho-2@26676
MVPLASAENKFSPFESNTTLFTAASWPSSVAMGCDERGSHILMVLSADPDASTLENGRNATVATESAWSRSTLLLRWLCRSHICTVWSMDALARNSPWSWKAHAHTGSLWSVNVARHVPRVTSHSLTVQSPLAVASWLPLGLNSRCETHSRWPSEAAMSSPEGIVHSFHVLSLPPVATTGRFGCTASAVTADEWAGMVVVSMYSHARMGACCASLREWLGRSSAGNSAATLPAFSAFSAFSGRGTDGGCGRCNTTADVSCASTDVDDPTARTLVPSSATLPPASECVDSARSDPFDGSAAKPVDAARKSVSVRPSTGMPAWRSAASSPDSRPLRRSRSSFASIFSRIAASYFWRSERRVGSTDDSCFSSRLTSAATVFFSCTTRMWCMRWKSRSLRIFSHFDAERVAMSWPRNTSPCSCFTVSVSC